ncbi:HAUS augmin-like complex subunit 2 [Cynoglossus semilaevis]|uniref:HAUS augmin like complex subunit 2 n=1 Tax=Cynoglossus semilaevis TaxID=244447 RepID=A0A3P8VWI8_CYNSE|nr:HAUS augmin-like complex subunit 2 [Cynoglossus semilaevis]XP_008312737.1 HAUS augmin-like complex subunit 2 [Cynoglossus semilaevis]XP_008312745.1 HAUS augmin-like complex subunit 2 [Cynoglossus semilaevis]
MNQWEVSPFFVSPAASVLSRCVSRGAMSQEDIDAVSSRPGPAFSSVLQEAEAQLKAQRRLDQLQLELELLKLEKQSADVTHVLPLSGRFQVLQTFCDHLQQLLKEQNSLRQRLMKPLGQTNLPIHAHLHRSVVEVLDMLLDFIETLEKKLDSVQNCSRAREQLSQMYTSLAQLLAQAAEVQTLSNQVLGWQEKGRSLQQ